jgi:UDP-N-acetylglucosamine 4,6-dehydratase
MPMPTTGGLRDRSVLITGGTGSFGGAFVQEVLRAGPPRRLVVLSRDEQKQYEMAQRFRQEDHPCLRYFIGDVRDQDRLRRAMYGIDTVVHAAAMKHVPIAEYNPFECIHTNIGGAENVISAAIDCGVERVIALSTDKAANPINLYGATKLASDKCFIAANHLAGGRKTRFSVVRYGNVVGSRGSVVEHFVNLVERGETTLPITDMRMTRFWITLERGVRFVLDRLGAMHGGELFVPKIKSMKIVDLARTLGPRCDLTESGIRPGEKLHEVLLPREEARQTVEFTDHYTVHPTFDWWITDDHLVENGERGTRVSEDFEYTSDTNREWLDSKELLAMIGR